MWAQGMLMEIGFRAVTDQNGDWGETDRLRHMFHNLVIFFMTFLPPKSSDEVIWIQKPSLETYMNDTRIQPMNLLDVHLLLLQPYNGHTLDNSFLLP